MTPKRSDGGAARVALLLLLLLAAAVRIYWGTRTRVVWGDEPFYLWLGRSLLSGDGYQFFGISGVHFSPLFPLLADLLGRAAPGVPAAGSLALYVACGSLLLLPVYAIAWRLAGERAAIAAATAAAFLPALTSGIPRWGTMTEPLYLLLIAAAWWALLVGLQDGRGWPDLAAGAFLGLAYLTRTEALAPAAAGLSTLFLLRCWGGPGFRRAGLGLAAGVAAFALVIFPYLWLLHGETGSWQLAEEAGSTYVSAQGLARGDVAAFDRATWGLDPASGEVYLFSPTSESQGLAGAILSDPRTFLQLLRLNIADLGRTVSGIRLVPLPLLALVALGLFAPPWDAGRLRGELLLASSLTGALAFLPFFIQDRYLATALIPAAVWIGEGTAWLGHWLATSWAAIRPGRARPAPDAFARLSPGEGSLLLFVPTVILAVGLLLAQPSLHAVLGRTRSFRPSHLAAAALLARVSDPEAVVLSRFPAIAYHAGRAWAPTPAASWPEVADYARRKGAGYLAVDPWELDLRPELAALGDPATAPSGLTALGKVGSGDDRVLLYAIDR